MEVNTVISILIILIGLLCIPIYYSTRSYFSRNGIILTSLLITTIILRFHIIEELPCRLYNKETILISTLTLFLPFLIFLIISIIRTQFFSGKRTYLFKLLLPYIFFGALQQALFQFVLSDTIFYLTNNTLITLILSAIFFYSFHKEWPKSDLKDFFPLLILFSLINSYIYIYLGNLIPQLLIHGTMGTVLYVTYSSTNQLERMKIERKQLHKKL
jgi:hypothetical protein